MGLGKEVGPQATTPRGTDTIYSNPTRGDEGCDFTAGDQHDVSAQDDVRAYLDVLYGGGVGFCHIVFGKGWYRNDNGTLQHRSWSETRARHVFSYPDDTDSIVADILDLAAQGVDVYVVTNLVRSAKSRRKNDVVSLWCLHADADNGLNLDEVAELGWCAISSGTPGHYHLYVPLSQSVNEAQFGALSGALINMLSADNKKACNDVLRPPWTRNFKPTLQGHDPVPVRWAVRPVKRTDPRKLAQALGIDFDDTMPSPDVKAKATGERAEAEKFDLNQYPSVQAAINKDSGDRSADTCGVMGAGLRAGLTFAQACWAVYQSPRLTERLNSRGDDHEVDLLRCWRRVVDEEQRSARHNGDGKADPGRVITLLRANEINDDIPDWLWDWDGIGRIMRGVLTLLAGRPGTGKSTAGRWFAARWSRGELPGLWLGKPQTVAYIASEESQTYVVKPGLRAAGADMTRIVFPEVRFNDKAVPLIAETDEQRLIAQFLGQGVTAIIVDPIMATIDSKVDIYRNNELRAALAPWVNIAAAINGTVTGIVHLRKGNNTDVVGAMNGSSAFGEVARCVFGFVKDPDDKKARVMSQVKNSCGPEDLSLAYEIRGESVTTDSGRQGDMPLFVVCGESDISVEEILNGDARRATGPMRQLEEFVNSREETDAEAVVKVGLAKNSKLASQMLGRLLNRGRIERSRHGVFTPLVKQRRDQRDGDKRGYEGFSHV